MFGGKRKKEKVATLCNELIAACKRQPQDFDTILRIVDSYPKATEYRDRDGLTALHWCCAKRAKLEIVQYLGNSRKGKSGLNEASDAGMHPLHYALREKAPIDVVEYLLRTNPSVAAKESEGGWYPLHYACAEKTTSPKIVIDLASSYPPAAKKATSEEKRLPLHYASAFQESAEVLSLLIRLAPGSTLQLDRNNWTPLHMAAANNDSLEVFEKLLQHDSYGIQKLANHKRIPLHIACLTQRPLDVVRYLHRQWPSGIKRMDDRRHLPLQAAACSGCSVDIMKYLIREWPQAANHIGKDSFEIARYMLQKYNPTKDEFDDLTRWLDRRIFDGDFGGGDNGGGNHHHYHDENNNHASSSSSRRSSRRHHKVSHRGSGGGGKRSSKSSSRSSRSGKRGDRRRGGGGGGDDEGYFSAPSLTTIEDTSVASQQTPSSPPTPGEEIPQEVLQMVATNLHEACEYPQDLKELRGLIGSFPKAAQCSTHNGNLPLHTACLNKAGKEIIEYLVEQYPEAVRRADDSGNTPLHLACFSSLPFESIEVLVEHWPESVLVKNDSYETPMERARQPFYEEPDDEVISLLEYVIMIVGGSVPTTRTTTERNDAMMTASDPSYSRTDNHNDNNNNGVLSSMASPMIPNRRMAGVVVDQPQYDQSISSNSQTSPPGGAGRNPMPDLDESIVSEIDGSLMSGSLLSATHDDHIGFIKVGGGNRSRDDSTMISAISDDFASADPLANKTMEFRRDRSEETSTLDQYDMDPSTNAAVLAPIADLFPNTTVVFADIVGFTSWSSAREPAQVFVLLETIHSVFDMLAYRYSMSRAESVGDCYVAVSGVPEASEDHAVQAFNFARSCLKKMKETTAKLEVALGPDTADLDLRIGIHSGQVTAGVMRGERSRFQLFGETVNIADRMQNSGERTRVQISQDTADLLKEARYGRWLLPRSDTIAVKGKGNMQTYWVRSEEDGDNEHGDDDGVEGADTFDSGLGWSLADLDGGGMSKVDRLIEWNVEVLSHLLQQIVASNGGKMERIEGLAKLEASLGKGATVLEDFIPTIRLKRFNADELRDRPDPRNVDIGEAAKNQLRAFLSTVSLMYRDNPFHNFEHAIHVAASVKKLLSRIVSVGTGIGGQQSADVDLVDLAGHSYGITSDPLTQFAVIFSAIIHDADHPGVPNAQLVKERTKNAVRYKHKSVAEQNSVDLCWAILMKAAYKDLRACIYQNEDGLRRFRQLVVNTVMATDIADKELQALRKARWEVAFSESPPEEPETTIVDRKATIVIEHLIQASDVSHTMQHWHIYKSWNEKFFMECYGAYRAGRAPSDPSAGWYKGEIGFFDFYVIPLAKKLDNCGVFGVSSDEYMNYAKANRDEWVREGEEIVREFLRKFEEKWGLQQDETSMHSMEDSIESTI